MNALLANIRSGWIRTTRIGNKKEHFRLITAAPSTSLNDRPEGVEAGTLKLVGISEEVMYNEFTKLLDNKKEYIEDSKSC